MQRFQEIIKRKLMDEGSELHEKIVQLKMLSPDSKVRLRYYRRFYEAFSKCPTLSDELTSLCLTVYMIY